MSYIDQSNYKDLLNKFAEGSKKQELKENYIDLRPINSLQEEVPTKMSHIYAKYPEGMYESDIKNRGKYKPKPYDLDGDGVPNGADKAPRDGAKHEGLTGDGPMLTGPTGYKLENLSLEERKQLKDYVESVKITKKAIDELLEKAKVRMEGGDNMGTISMPTGE